MICMKHLELEHIPVKNDSKIWCGWALQVQAVDQYNQVFAGIFVVFFCFLQKHPKLDQDPHLGWGCHNILTPARSQRLY